MKIIYILFLGLLVPLFLFSQEKSIEIKGYVLYKDEPVPGSFLSVSSLEKQEIALGTTNEDGYFNIKVSGRSQDFSITAESMLYEKVSFHFKFNKDSLVVMTFIAPKVNTLDSVVINTFNKHIKYFADKTVFDVENISMLNIGTLSESINKLPGMLMLTNGNIIYNGKSIKVFINGEPINLTGDQLTSFLHSYPINMVKSIETIENPGAKYKANSNSGIINIITKTNNKSLKGISGSIMQQNSVNDNFKNSTSVNLFLKRNKLSWASTSSFSNKKSNNETSYSYSILDNDLPIRSVKEDLEIIKTTKNIFTQNTFQYNISKRSNLNLNYLYSNYRNEPLTRGKSIVTLDQVESHYQESSNNIKSNNHSLQLIYNQELDTAGTKLIITSRGRLNNSFGQNKMLIDDRLNSSISTNTKENAVLFKFDLERKLRKSKSELSLGAYFENNNSNNNGNRYLVGSTPYLPYDFKYRNSAGYVNLSKNVNPLMFSFGLRLENLDYKGTLSSIDSVNIEYNSAKLFPSLNVRYQLIPGVSMRLGYNKKIELPNLNQYNPNISSQSNLLIFNKGNSSIEPQINHNFNFNISAFDYFVINTFHNIIPVQNINLYEAEDNRLILSQHSIKNTSISGINIGFPIPYSVLSKDFKDVLKSRNQLDINKMTFSYFNLGWNRYNLGDELPFEVRENSFFMNSFTQIYLKNDLRLYLNYYLFLKGGWDSYYLNRSSQNLDIYFNKKLVRNKFSVTFGVYNILNNAGYDINSYGKDAYVNINNTNEKRLYRLGISYSFGSFKDNSSVIPENGSDIAPLRR